MAELAASLGISQAALNRTVYLGTHGHYDHVGSMSQRDVPIYLGFWDAWAVKRRDRFAMSAFYYGEQAPSVTAQPLGAHPDMERYSVSGTRLHGLRMQLGGVSIKAFATPGHTRSSVSYIVGTPDGNALLAGDTLWGMESKKRLHSSPRRWLKSLRVLRTLVDAEEVTGVSFGHGVSELIGQPADHLDEAIESMQMRIEHGLVNPWQWQSLAAREAAITASGDLLPVATDSEMQASSISVRN